MEHEYEYKRAMIFFKKKIVVHASTNIFFTNGIIIEISKDHVVIIDRKDGHQKLIFFSELKKPLEPTKEKKYG